MRLAAAIDLEFASEIPILREIPEGARLGFIYTNRSCSAEIGGLFGMARQLAPLEIVGRLAETPDPRYSSSVALVLADPSIPLERPIPELMVLRLVDASGVRFVACKASDG